MASGGGVIDPQQEGPQPPAYTPKRGVARRYYLIWFVGQPDMVRCRSPLAGFPTGLRGLRLAPSRPVENPLYGLKSGRRAIFRGVGILARRLAP